MASVQTKDYIVQLIKEEILSGVMKPGEELAQEALAERLGVSRMPIREALQNLVQEGFAVRLPNRHIQAVVLSAQQIHDVFHVGGDRYVGIILYGKRGAAVLPIVRGCFRLEYRRLEHRLYPSPHPYRENHHYQHDAGRAYRGIGLPRKFLQGIHEKGLYISTRKYINVKIR